MAPPHCTWVPIGHDQFMGQAQFHGGSEMSVRSTDPIQEFFEESANIYLYLVKGGN